MLRSKHIIYILFLLGAGMVWPMQMAIGADIGEKGSIDAEECTAASETVSESSGKSGGSMKITIVYDNETDQKGLTADWGFACVIQYDGRTVLFDTGAKGDVLMQNMKVMHVDPVDIDEVFISHAHWDHTGGLTAFLRANHDVTVYVPKSMQDVRGVDNVVTIDTAQKLHNGFYSTGELKDTEQSLLIKTDTGLVVIVGCSHPGVTTILNAAERYGKPFALIGGLHGFNDFDALGDLSLICPTHCTQYKTEIETQYPEQVISGGAGVVIEI